MSYATHCVVYDQALSPKMIVDGLDYGLLQRLDKQPLTESGKNQALNQATTSASARMVHPTEAMPGLNPWPRPVPRQHSDAKAPHPQYSGQRPD